MTEDELTAAWLRLTLTPGIGGERQRKLLAAFGLPHQIYQASPAQIAAVIGERMAGQLLTADNHAAVEAALAWGKKPGHRILTLADPAYPRRLLEIADPPSVLYVRGSPDALSHPAVAIVGSRNATPQGEANARAFASSLAEAGLAIVSGLALGIDAAAHRGALAVSGTTIAVIGTGADRLYPARNRDLAMEIADKGVIISEFPLGTPANAANFPRRNRIISGLSGGVLVVEAALGSGSLITARTAGEQGREVMAIPGSIHSPLSRGCHALIRQGAKLVESAADILEELPFFERSNPLPSPSEKLAEKAYPPESDEERVLACAGHDPVSIDELISRSGLTAESLSVILLQLELDGRVASLPGGRIQRLADHTSYSSQ